MFRAPRRGGFHRPADASASAGVGGPGRVLTESGDLVPAEWYDEVQWAAAELARLIETDGEPAAYTTRDERWTRWVVLYRGPIDETCRARFLESEAIRSDA